MREVKEEEEEKQRRDNNKIPEYIATFPKPRITYGRLDAIRQLKRDNPNASWRELRMLSGEGEYTISKALKK